MRAASLLIICLMLAACGMKGDLYEPAPAPAPVTAPAAMPAANHDPAMPAEPRDDRKAVPPAPDPGRSR